MSRFYLTTAIDYSNGEPHLGHAFEKIGADVIARYRRAAGDEVRFAIGMDEHGQKIAQEAAARGIDPQVLVDEMAARFRALWETLGISNDDFIRTTEPRHARAVTALIERIQRAGDLYLDRYEGYYCVGCEAFKKEDELVDGRCPIHPTREIVWTEEENYFFRLSGYRDRLLAHLREHPEFVRPESRRNEVLRLLEGGLEDVSASRARLPWGVPFPGAEGHSVYVWFDALPNYLSAIGFPDGDYESWWPARLHVIGKDITRFHCVIWPAMLLSAGLELPGTVWGHGFISVAGGKLSKSGGARLELPELVDRHGPDAFRYFLMREVPWDGDRDFGPGGGLVEQFDARYNAELANDLGNLLNRTLAMIGKYRDGRVPGGRAGALDEQLAATVRRYRDRMDAYLLHEALESVLAHVRSANGYVDESRPWELARREREGEADAGAELDAALGALARSLAAVGVLLAPFMPERTAELWRQLGGEGELPSMERLGDPELASGGTVRWGEVLFPRFEPEEDVAEGVPS